MDRWGCSVANPCNASTRWDAIKKDYNVVSDIIKGRSSGADFWNESEKERQDRWNWLKPSQWSFEKELYDKLEVVLGGKETTQPPYTRTSGDFILNPGADAFTAVALHVKSMM